MKNYILDSLIHCSHGINKLTNVPFFLFTVNDKTVVSRSCFWEDVNAPRDSCYSTNTPSYIKTEYCQTCNTDGCNGAGQFGPIAMLVAVPVVVAKMLVL